MLSDPEKRKQYDQMRRLGAFDGGPRALERRRPAAAVRRADVGSEGFDFGDFGGLGDIFSSIFGRGRREEPRGETIEAVVEVPFRIGGARRQDRRSTLPVTDACPTCGGNGGAPGATGPPVPSATDGARSRSARAASRSTAPARSAAGAGKIPSQPCPTCRGAGEVRTERAGDRSPCRRRPRPARAIRLKGQGEPGRGGAPPGDLIVTFQVQPDRFFRRDGLDIVCEVPINLAQAMLGTRIRVRTLDGKKVMLRIPAGTQPGRKFRIKGQGVEKNGRRGDQLVAFSVDGARGAHARAGGAAEEVRRVGRDGLLAAQALMPALDSPRSPRAPQHPLTRALRLARPRAALPVGAVGPQLPGLAVVLPHQRAGSRAASGGGADRRSA